MLAKWQKLLLQARPKIECSFDYLKEHLFLVSSFPRSIQGYFVYYARILLAYLLMWGFLRVKLEDLVIKYLGPKRRAGKYFYEPAGQNWEHEIFPNSKFSNFDKISYIVSNELSVDMIVGLVFSMSWSSKKLLGSKAAEFETELRQQLFSLLQGRSLIVRTEFVAYMLQKNSR